MSEAATTEWRILSWHTDKTRRLLQDDETWADLAERWHLRERLISMGATEQEIQGILDQARATRWIQGLLTGEGVRQNEISTIIEVLLDRSLDILREDRLATSSSE